MPASASFYGLMSLTGLRLRDRKTLHYFQLRGLVLDPDFEG